MTSEQCTDVTFVLTSCGRFDLLQETLSSFFAYNTAPIARYLLIEDSGFDAVRNVAASFPFPIEVIVNRPSLGQIASIDKGYATVTTPYVFHCEDDWRFFRSGFVEDSLALLQLDPSIVVVCSRRLDQKKSLCSLLDVPLVTIGGVSHRKRPWRDGLYGGYTFNPGLRRMSDYRMLGSFKRWGDESDASLFFKRKGMAVAYLAAPACETTGANRRLPKQKPVRNAWSRLQRLWYDWRFRIRSNQEAEKALEQAKWKHDASAKKIEKDRAALDKRSQAENARWEKQKKKLETALRRAETRTRDNN